VQNHFWKKHLCALQVFLCACVSRPVRARTSAQLRKNSAPEIILFLGDPRCQKGWLRKSASLNPTQQYLRYCIIEVLRVFHCSTAY